MNGHSKNSPGLVMGLKSTAGIASSSAVKIGSGSGITIIPDTTPLARLNYFDGQFLRAEHLNREQLYLRRLVELSNQADGSGITHGFDVTLSGGELFLSDGLAIDPEGRVLVLPEGRAVSIEELLAKSQTTQPSQAKVTDRFKSAEFGECIITESTDGGTVQAGTSLYLLTIAHAESLCGEEDVYGRLCEDACVSGTQKPYWLEGVVFRARPLVLTVPFPVSKAVPLTRVHLRSSVASAYFESERRRIAHLISRTGLASEVWCLGAEGESGNEVPVGVLARAGSSTIFLDSWIARRERIETTSHRYWQWRMAMRAKDIYLAQVFQFQCQLRDLLGTGGATEEDPCADTRRVLTEAEESYLRLTQFYTDVADRLASSPELDQLDSVKFLRAKGTAPLQALSKKLTEIKDVGSLSPSNRILIEGGIIELPSAGYLPVAPGEAMSVNEQVRRWMGEGVDLRFCVVRPDYVPHAWEEAQHMERISLLTGLETDGQKPRVDILVPDGELIRQQTKVSYRAFQARSGGLSRFSLEGAARMENTPGGKLSFYSAMAGSLSNNVNRAAAENLALGRNAREYISTLRSGAALGTPVEGSFTLSVAGSSAWGSLEFDRDPFELQANQQTSVRCRMILLTQIRAMELHDIEAIGTLRVLTTGPAPGVSAGIAVDAGFVGSIRHSVRQANTPSAGAAPSGKLKVRLVRLSTSGETQILVQADGIKEDFHVTLSTTAGGAPLKVTGSLRFRTPDTPEAPDVPAELLQDSAVMNAGDPRNSLARSALQVLEAALEEEGFAAASAKLLFDTPAKAEGDLIVRATRDWVLFHRRREKNCGEDTPPLKPAPQRTYRIMHLPLTRESLGRLAEIRKLLHASSPDLSKTEFESSGQVVFEGGASDLVTPAATVRADWERLRPGQRILYGAIGSRGAAEDEGPALAAARLDQTVSALAPVSVPERNAVFEDLPGAPLAAEGTDGTIFVITLRETAVERERVWVFSNEDFYQLALTLARRGQWDIIEQRRLGVQLADVRFTAGESEPDAQDATTLKNRWRSENFRVASEAVAISASEDTALARARAEKTLTLVNSLQAKLQVDAGLTGLEPAITSVLLLRGIPATAPAPGPAPAPAPQPVPGGGVLPQNRSATARIVFVKQGSFRTAPDGNISEVSRRKKYFVKFDASNKIEGAAPAFGEDLKNRVTAIAIGAGGLDRSKALAEAMDAQGLLNRNAAGETTVKFEEVKLHPDLDRLRTDEATDVILVEVTG